MSLDDKTSDKSRSQHTAGLRDSLSTGQLDNEIEADLTHQSPTIPDADRCDDGSDMTFVMHEGTELEDIPLALRGLGANVNVAECGYMAGIQVGANVNILSEIGTFDSPTENLKVIYMYRTKKMTNQAIGGNRGHFESEIEWTDLKSSEDKPRIDHFDFLVGLGVIVLVSGTELEVRLTQWKLKSGIPCLILMLRLWTATGLHQILSCIETGPLLVYGIRFELRTVGTAQNVASLVIVLNTTMSEDMPILCNGVGVSFQHVSFFTIGFCLMMLKFPRVCDKLKQFISPSKNTSSRTISWRSTWSTPSCLTRNKIARSLTKVWTRLPLNTSTVIVYVRTINGKTINIKCDRQ